MPKDIDQQIIDYLLTHTEFTTSDELSSELGVSSKTITRHVDSINKKFSKQIINAKRGQGYKLDYATYLDVANENSQTNSSVKLRREYIVTKLLFAAPNAVMIYDLVNKLYISESVLQTDVKEIGQRLEKWDLKLVRKQRSLRVVGSEKAVRDALIEVVFHLSNATDIDAVANGISKVNISSDYKHAFFAKVHEILAENDGWDPNTLFPEAIEAGKKVVHHKNKLFNAVGKAALYEGIDPWRAEFI